jgi:DNA excision repair protein ERCC-2
MTTLFPHSSIRPVQEEFITSVEEALNAGKNLIAHAPTGLGKTAASLAPAVEFARKNDKIIFFLTSRHTQHKIAIDTLNMIKEKHDVEFNVVDFIGKQNMCLVSGAQALRSNEFFEYCKTVSRKDYTCPYYVNTRDKNGKPTMKAQAALKEIRAKDLDGIMEFSGQEKFCPYEMTMMLSKNARVVVCDYYYIFNDNIRNMILGRMEKEMSDVIIIADEAHNLPFRIRNLMTSRTTKNLVERAAKEAEKFEYFDVAAKINDIAEGIEQFSLGLQLHEEKLLPKEELVTLVEEVVNGIEPFIEELEEIADLVREDQKASFVGSFSIFLQEWMGEDEGFTRIISKREGIKENNIIISYRCLDPGIVSKGIIDQAYSTILMSGTLVPAEMYRDLLEVSSPMIRIFESPFPKKNRLNLIVPETTTKFTRRNDGQFQKIAQICASITNNVPGNSAIFFPSYALRDKVNAYFNIESSKSQLTEQSGMSTEEKREILQKLEGYKETGIVLLGASSGSFGEGVDFPGDLLKCVIVVGLPLRSPDLETRETIDYFDRKFGKGWDYGYVYPAFNRTLQNAGRCIRSETDKGIVVFLDERYSWPQYFRCFPDDIQIKITKDYDKEVLSFFHGGLQQKLVEEEDI